MTYKLLTVALLTYTSVCAQLDSTSLQQLMERTSFHQKFEAANILMDDSHYNFALPIWLELLNEQPNNSNLNYKVGLCYLNLKSEHEKALQYFQLAADRITPHYDPFSTHEKRSPIDVNFYLGKAYHQSGEFQLAFETLGLFLEKISPEHVLYKASDLAAIQSDNALRELKIEHNYSIENLGKQTNSMEADYGPVISTDGNTLFFTSKRTREENQNIYNRADGKHYEDVYKSIKSENNQWSTPELMSFCSPESNQATISISPDGVFLYAYIDDRGDGNIYYSEKENEKFGPLTKMGENINSEYNETHLTISADGNTMYFVSDRPGGEGGRDIWKCNRLPNGNWSEAQNAGPTINSPYDEETPFLHIDGKTLFFSSNGDRSIGGFDIFYSTLKEEEWQEPVNMGFPINTVENDVAFTTTADGKTGYYSSVHGKNEIGDLDIYEVNLDTAINEQITILKGHITYCDEELPKGIKIWVQDLTEESRPHLYRPNRTTGDYVMSLIPGHEYDLDYTYMDSSFFQTQVTIPENSSYMDIQKTIQLNLIDLVEE